LTTIFEVVGEADIDDAVAMSLSLHLPGLLSASNT